MEMAGREKDFEGMVLGVARSALDEAGIVVQSFRTETGYGLLDSEAGVELYLDNVTEAARSEGPAWREVVTGWVGQFLVARAEQMRELTEAEVRAALRTRLMWSDDDRTYARQLVDGLDVILSLDGATSVQNHSDRSIAALGERLGMSLDELYALGQANTDAEPIDEVFEVIQDVYAFTGDSFFVAAKVANFPALLDVIGPAPLGVAFAPLNRHLVLFTVIRGGAESLMQAMALAHQADGLVHDEEFDHPGGLLTDTTYYWAPDGRIEYLARRSMLVDGEPTVTVLPGEAFNAFVGVGGAA